MFVRKCSYVSFLVHLNLIAFWTARILFQTAIQNISKEQCSRDTGKVVDVLVEEKNDHDAAMVTGRMSNNLLVHFVGEESLIGKLVSVKLEECKGFYYIGTLVE